MLGAVFGTKPMDIHFANFCQASIWPNHWLYPEERYRQRWRSLVKSRPFGCKPIKSPDLLTITQSVAIILGSSPVGLDSPIYARAGVHVWSFFNAWGDYIPPTTLCQWTMGGKIPTAVGILQPVMTLTFQQFILSSFTLHVSSVSRVRG